MRVLPVSLFESIMGEMKDVRVKRILVWCHSPGRAPHAGGEARPYEVGECPLSWRSASRHTLAAGQWAQDGWQEG